LEDNLKVEVETLGPSRKLLRIEIPAEVVNAELNRNYEELSKKASVPGFRRGRIPHRILKARFAEYVKNESIQNLVPPACEEAIKEQGIIPLGNLELKPDITEIVLKENQPLIFEAAVDVKPEMQLPSYQAIEIDKKDVDVPRENVNEYIELLRHQKVTFVPVETDRAVEANDSVKVNWEYSVAGELVEDSKREGVILELSSGDNLPDIEKGLAGMKPSEKRDVKVNFPPEHPDENLAGKEVTFHITLQTITDKKLPELDDEFAKDLGYDSYEQLVGAIWNNLVEEGRVIIRRKQREEVVQQLIEKTPFDAPESIIQQQIDAMIANIQQQLRRDKRTPSEAGIDMEKLPEELQPEAIQRIKRAWIFEAIAEKENIDVTEDELNRQVRLIAEGQNKDPQKYASLLKANNRIDGIRETLREEKIYDFLIQNVSEKRSLIVQP